MEHTPVDLIVVDDRHRLPIGRPYLTAAIDVFSRCVVGVVVTLEAPSALSVGLYSKQTVRGPDLLVGLGQATRRCVVENEAGRSTPVRYGDPNGGDNGRFASSAGHSCRSARPEGR